MNSSRARTSAGTTSIRGEAARLDPSDCPCPAWLPGGHLQTLHAALFARHAATAFVRERLELPDSDFLDIDWSAPGLHPDAPADGPAAPIDASLAPTGARRWLQPSDHACLAEAATDSPALILFHGLEGSSRSHYAQAIAHHFRTRGWIVAVAHFRGCSGFPNRLARAYHSGDSADVAALLDGARARAPQARWHAAGVSLGGNALLRHVAVQPPGAHWLEACAAVSVPLDLVACGISLSNNWLGRQLYTRHFFRTMKAKVSAKALRFPGNIDGPGVARARSLREFDDAYTAPIHGYRDAIDYWTQASSRPLLGQISLPCLVLNARNDPFVPASSLPGVQEASSEVLLHQPAQGGHAAFVTGPFPGRLDWLPARLARFFEQGC